MREKFRNFDSKISFFAFADIITAICGVLIFTTLLLATDLARPTGEGAHSSDQDLQRKLAETQYQQAEIDAQITRLQQLLAAAETAPDPDKLKSDISRLTATLADEKKKHAALAEQLAKSQSLTEARDRTLGFTDLKAQIQRIVQEVELVGREDGKVRDEVRRLDQRAQDVQSKILKLRAREGKLWLIPDRSSTTKEPILAVISGSSAKLERFDHPEQGKEFSRATARDGFASYLKNARSLDQYFVFLVRPSGIELFDSLVKLARDRGFEVGFDALEENKDVYFATPPAPDESLPPFSSAAAPGFSPGGRGYTAPAGGAGANTNPPEFTRPGTNALSPTNQPKPSPPPKIKSWWQRFLEWMA